MRRGDRGRHDMRASAPTCEHVVRWVPTGGGAEFCGKVAVRRYLAVGGGYMYMCLHHAKGHESYAELCYEGEWETSP